MSFDDTYINEVEQKFEGENVKSFFSPMIKPKDIWTDRVTVEPKTTSSEATQTGRSPTDAGLSGDKGTANPGSITPTVVLNGLAMARGEKVSYEVIQKTPLPSRPIYNISKSYFPNMWFYPYDDTTCGPLNRFRQEPIKRWIYRYIFHVKVTVGDREFFGEGKSQQAARHSAAKSALNVLQEMPIPSKPKSKKSSETKLSQTGNCAVQKEPAPKSPISLLYEKVSVSRLKLTFNVIHEEGPSHLKLFTMEATIAKNKSDVLLQVQGKGNSKNIAKVKAAEAALEELKLNPLPQRTVSKKKAAASETKIAGILSSATALHPSSRLSQIMQAKRETLPIYEPIPTDNSNSRPAFYKMQCKAMGRTTVGEAKSKKDAKRDASEKMLKLLGLFPESIKSEEQSSAVLISSNSRPKSRHKIHNKGTVTDVLPPLPEL